MKEESEKVGLKLNIQKTKIMASGLITSWEIDGETVETVADFIFLSSKIIEDGDCSHEIKRRLLLGRKVMTNLDNILKSKDIQFSSVHFSSVTQSCLTVCDAMSYSMPGFPVHHQCSEPTQIHVHRVNDVIQPSHPLTFPSPPAFNLSQHQGLFQ